MAPPGCVDSDLTPAHLPQHSISEFTPITRIDESSALARAADLATLPCTLRLSSRRAFGAVRTLIKEARRLYVNFKQCLMFLLALNLTLQLTQLSNAIFLSPPLLSPIHILFLALVIAPMLSIPIMATTHRQLLKLMPEKNTARVNRFEDAVRYYFVRFALTILWPIVLHAWVVVDTSGGLVSWTEVFGGGMSDEAISSPRVASAVVYAQSVVTCFIVLYFSCVGEGGWCCGLLVMGH